MRQKQVWGKKREVLRQKDEGAGTNELRRLRGPHQEPFGRRSFPGIDSRTFESG